MNLNTMGCASSANEDAGRPLQLFTWDTSPMQGLKSEDGFDLATRLLFAPATASCLVHKLLFHLDSTVDRLRMHRLPPFVSAMLFAHLARTGAVKHPAFIDADRKDCSADADEFVQTRLMDIVRSLLCPMARHTPKSWLAVRRQFEALEDVTRFVIVRMHKAAAAIWEMDQKHHLIRTSAANLSPDNDDSKRRQSQVQILERLALVLNHMFYGRSLLISQISSSEVDYLLDQAQDSNPQPKRTADSSEPLSTWLHHLLSAPFVDAKTTTKGLVKGMELDNFMPPLKCWQRVVLIRRDNGLLSAAAGRQPPAVVPAFLVAPSVSFPREPMIWTCAAFLRPAGSLTHPFFHNTLGACQETPLAAPLDEVKWAQQLIVGSAVDLRVHMTHHGTVVGTRIRRIKDSTRSFPQVLVRFHRVTRRMLADDEKDRIPALKDRFNAMTIPVVTATTYADVASYIDSTDKNEYEMWLDRKSPSLCPPQLQVRAIAESVRIRKIAADVPGSIAKEMETWRSGLQNGSAVESLGRYWFAGIVVKVEAQTDRILVEYEDDGVSMLQWVHRSDSSLAPPGFWRSRLRPGDRCDTMDADRRWYQTMVLDANSTSVRVHYIGWERLHDAWILRSSPLLARPMSHAFVYNLPLTVGEYYPHWDSEDMFATCRFPIDPTDEHDRRFGVHRENLLPPKQWLMFAKSQADILDNKSAKPKVRHPKDCCADVKSGDSQSQSMMQTPTQRQILSHMRAVRARSSRNDDDDDDDKDDDMPTLSPTVSSRPRPIGDECNQVFELQHNGHLMSLVNHFGEYGGFHVLAAAMNVADSPATLLLHIDTIKHLQPMLTDGFVAHFLPAFVRLACTSLMRLKTITLDINTLRKTAKSLRAILHRVDPYELTDLRSGIHLLAVDTVLRHAAVPLMRDLRIIIFQYLYQTAKQEAVWQCSLCTLVNETSAKKCAVCSGPNPNSSVPAVKCAVGPNPTTDPPGKATNCVAGAGIVDLKNCSAQSATVQHSRLACLRHDTMRAIELYARHEKRSMCWFVESDARVSYTSDDPLPHHPLRGHVIRFTPDDADGKSSLVGQGRWEDLGVQQQENISFDGLPPPAPPALALLNTLRDPMIEASTMLRQFHSPWNCASCTFQNRGGISDCEICLKKRTPESLQTTS